MRLNDLLGEDYRTIIDDSPDYSQNIGKRVLKLNIVDIIPNPDQPRRTFNQDSIQELSDSISQNGVLQPILVKKIDDKYQIIAGERRFLATKHAGLNEIECIVTDIEDEKKLFVNSIIENIQRENLNPLDEALAYRKLQDTYNMTHDDISKHVNKPRSHISNMIRILSLPYKALEYLKEGRVSFGHAKILASISDEQEIDSKLQKILDDKLSVRELERSTTKTKKRSESSRNKDVIDPADVVNAIYEDLTRDELDSLEKKDIEMKFQEITTLMSNRTGFDIQIVPHGPFTGSVNIKFDSHAELEKILENLLIAVRK